MCVEGLLLRGFGMEEVLESMDLEGYERAEEAWGSKASLIVNYD